MLALRFFCSILFQTEQGFFMNENKQIYDLARNPSLATVRQYISEKSTPINMYYGDQLISTCNPPASFDIVFGGVKIQSEVQDTFYCRSKQRAGFVRFLSVTVNGHSVPSLKPIAKTIITALVILKKINMPMEQALRDQSDLFR